MDDIDIFIYENKGMDLKPFLEKFKEESQKELLEKIVAETIIVSHNGKEVYYVDKKLVEELLSNNIKS